MIATAFTRVEKTFDPHVPGIPGDGSPVVLHTDTVRGLTFTWHDISRRVQDWRCRESGYLVSRLVVTDSTGAEVGGLNVTHTTPELVAAEMPTPFHWADENTGTSFGFAYRDVTPQIIWAAAYTALHTWPPSMAGKSVWVLGASNAPEDPQVLAAELDAAERALAGQVQQFIEWLSVPFVDYAHLDETYTSPAGERVRLRSRGGGNQGAEGESRGAGVGQVMYRLAAQRLAEQGKGLRASGLQSPEAEALWRRLVADPSTPTREVTVRFWKTSEPKVHVCLDYTTGA